jgi:hypothetical protein
MVASSFTWSSHPSTVCQERPLHTTYAPPS